MQNPNNQQRIFEPTESWRSRYPEAYCGILAIRNVCNPTRHSDLEGQQRELLGELKARYSGGDRNRLKEIDEIVRLETS